jgi:heme-degrading monooxygenase HmoA
VIVRSWTGYASIAAAEAYPRHLLKSVRPQLEQLDGFQGLFLLRRVASSEVEYRVLTLWTSMEAIGAFAGATPERAVVEPEAQAALVRYDEQVCHYEVLASPDDGCTSSQAR